MKSTTEQFLNALRRLENADEQLRNSNNPETLLDAAEAEVAAMDELDRLFQDSSLTGINRHVHHEQVEAA